MKKENQTTNTNMDFSSASAIIGGLDSFIEEGVSFNTNEETNTDKEKELDIDLNVEEENETEGKTNVEGKTVDPEKADPEKADPEKVNPEKKEENKNSNIFDFKQVINSLVENKIFEGFDTIETEDGEISFEDFEVDENTFVDIIKSKLDEIKETAASNTTKGLSDFTKHLLEIEKNGGNVSQALETYQNYQNPLESFDLSDEIDQQKVIFMKYHQVMGMEKDVVMDLIEGFVNKGKLEDEAIKADTEIRNAVSKQLEAINEQAKKNKDKKKENLKIYRDKLRENLNSFDINDNYKRKILDLATKEDESGNFQLDSVYYEIRNNPEKAASLILFLTDPEEYNKQVTSKEVRNTQLDTFKKLKLVKRGGDNIKIQSKDKKPINNKDLIDIEEIFGN